MPPEDDLPADFEERRSESYRELRKPLDPTAFSDGLREEITAALDELDAAIPTLDLDTTDRAAGAITLRSTRRRPIRATCDASRARYVGGGERSP